MSVVFLILLSLNFLRSDVALSSEGILSSLPLTTMFFLAGGLLALRNDTESRAGHAATASGVIMLVGSLGAATSMVVLRWGFPQADAALLHVDKLLGFDVRDIVAETSQFRSLNDTL